MQKKKGISLIVLVITIIVMIILAAAIIISLSNSGIIGKANDAVEKTNLKQVQQLASIAWADAYAIGKTSQAELEEYVLDVLDKNKVNKDKYIITVTPEGVDVELKENAADAMNEHGFYFERAYAGTFIVDGGQITMAFVFHQDGSAEVYTATAETNNILFCNQGFPRDSLSYANKSISMGDETGTVSPDGLSITMDGVTLSCTSLEIHGGYRNKIYSAEVEGLGTLEAVLSNNNVATLFLNGAQLKSLNVTTAADDHIILKDGSQIGMLSLDGKQLLLNLDEFGEVILALDEDNDGENTGLTKKITWRGPSVEGLASVTISGTEWYKISDIGLKFDELYGAKLKATAHSGEQVGEVFESNLVETDDMFTFGEAAENVSSFLMLWFVAEDGATYNGTVFSQKGIYISLIGLQMFVGTDDVTLEFEWDIELGDIDRTYPALHPYLGYTGEEIERLRIPDVISIGNNTYILRVISEDSFSSCQNLTSVVIPNGVRKIERIAFPASVTDIYYTGTQQEWEAIVKATDWASNPTIHYNYVD